MTKLQDLIGRPVAAIDTPALVLDLDAMERNLATMATFAGQHQVRLRPHAKMHKSAELAKLQMAAGAVGVCVQKTSEAEALVAGGVSMDMTECDVVKRAGPPEKVEVGTNERSERTAVLTYIRGPKPGIYFFTSGRLTALDRAPEPPPSAKPVAKKKKPAPRKPAAT